MKRMHSRLQLWWMQYGFKSWRQANRYCAKPLQLLPNIRKKLGEEFPIIIDSGFSSGQDISKALALGADFVMLGRPFMIGLAALGKKGAEHIHYILRDELSNIMEQLCCKDISEIKSQNTSVSSEFFLSDPREYK